MDFASINFQAILIGIPILILSGSIHEFAHAYFAEIQGDNTPKNNGRLTLNPMAHIDIIGTIVFPILNVVTGIPVFGWMKPVPTNPNNFDNPSKGQALVAFAGPFSNFIQASLGALLYKLILLVMNFVIPVFPIAAIPVNFFLTEILKLYIIINILLMFFNIFPFPPLDGGWILRHILPDRGKEIYDKMYPFGFLILIGLMITGIFSYIFLVPAMILINLFFSGLYNSSSLSIFYFIIPVLFGLLILFLLIKKEIIRIKNKMQFINKLKNSENIIKEPALNKNNNNEKLNDIINKLKNNEELNDDDKNMIMDLKDKASRINSDTPVCSEIDFNIDEHYCNNCENFLSCILRYINNLNKNV